MRLTLLQVAGASEDVVKVGASNEAYLGSTAPTGPPADVYQDQERRGSYWSVSEKPSRGPF